MDIYRPGERLRTPAGRYVRILSTTGEILSCEYVTETGDPVPRNSHPRGPRAKGKRPGSSNDEYLLTLSADFAHHWCRRVGVAVDLSALRG